MSHGYSEVSRVTNDWHIQNLQATYNLEVLLFTSWNFNWHSKF
jgi:hypothetical protein